MSWVNVALCPPWNLFFMLSQFLLNSKFRAWAVLSTFAPPGGNKNDFWVTWENLFWTFSNKLSWWFYESPILSEPKPSKPDFSQLYSSWWKAYGNNLFVPIHTLANWRHFKAQQFLTSKGKQMSCAEKYHLHSSKGHSEKSSEQISKCINRKEKKYFGSVLT